jgi:arylsulfatase A-like enzyme
MKVIVLMFDSLNRHMLQPYGCDWTHTPNFKRLAERTVTFDRSYVCSMPCMPARRDLHTGRPNFLHRYWGPLEPYDDSIFEMLKKAGVYSHLSTDHYHYFEDGGATYHNRYNSWEFFRGQEGDAWKGQVADPPRLPSIGRNAQVDEWTRHDWINRQFLKREVLQPQPQTMASGLDFLRRNHQEDNWVLQIETFDPHEPFFSQRKYKDIYAEHYDRYRKAGGKHFDWPIYRGVEETPEEIEHLRFEYAALLSMCDAYLGDVLDTMDELDMWKDTMLVVWTDHGFMLGEHNCLAKIWMPFYEEVAHTPFFVWDPRCGKRGERRQSLIQPAIDLSLTLLGCFGIQPTPDMLGKDLASAISRDEPVRDVGIFGIHGGHVNVTDGRYFYRHAPPGKNEPVHEYALMPSNMRYMFSVERMQQATLAKPFKFTKNCPLLCVPPEPRKWHQTAARSELFDLQNDPQQMNPIQDKGVQDRLIQRMVELMKQCDAPAEQYQRLGL